jgi:hypothetical protein
MFYSQVMITTGVTQIPESHIMRRWTRDAYQDMPDHLMMYQNDSPVMKSTSFRHSALYRTAIEIVQLGDSNPESYEIAMAHMLDAMPALSQASKTIDGLGLEERVHAAGCSTAAEGEPNFSGSLRPNMVAPPKRSELGRPTNARAKPRYEVSVPRTNSALYAMVRDIGLMVAQRTRTTQRNPAERPIAPIVVCLVTRRITV